jgi:hypothetical protein
MLQLADNVKSWRLERRWQLRAPNASAQPINAQEMLLANVGAVLVGIWQGGTPLPALAPQRNERRSTNEPKERRIRDREYITPARARPVGQKQAGSPAVLPGLPR